MVASVKQQVAPMIKQANSMLVILVSFMLAYWIRYPNMPLTQEYLVALLLTLILSLIVFPASGAFRKEFEWAFLRKLRRMMVAWLLAL